MILNIDSTYRIVLFGHRDFRAHSLLDEKLFVLIRDLIVEKPFVEIYLGRNGEFDCYAASLIKRVQKAFGNANSTLICVLPYFDKNICYYEAYYDSIIIPACLHNIHPKGAITKRNRWMVERADLFIGYIEQENGGAYQAMKYAQKLKKPIINLAKNCS